MLQRIQSLYLLISAIIFAMLFFVNIYKIESTTTPLQTVTMSVTSLTVFEADATNIAPPQFQLFSFLLNLILLILTVVSIFWYKNRIQQNLMVKFCMLLNSGLLVFLLLSTDKLKSLISSTTVSASYQFTIALPVISLVLLFLAGRSIMKDENLIRSADRLR